MASRVLLTLLALDFALGSQVPYGLLLDLKPTPHAGIDRAQPTISWIVPHMANCNTSSLGQIQSHFQLQLAGSPDFATVLGDSGRTASESSLAVPWPVHDLKPATTYWCRLRIWTPEGCASHWSETTKIITGNFGHDFSVAKPVWVDGAEFVFLRKVVELRSKKVVSAHAYAVAVPVGNAEEKYLGAYRLYIDGIVVGTGPGRGSRKYSEPGHPDYDTLDVTEVVSGKTKVAFALQGFNDKGDSSAKALVEMHIKYEDGSVQVVGTDSTWSALNANQLFNAVASSSYPINNQGPQENIDARLSPSGDGCMTCWRHTEFISAEPWQAAQERDAFSPALQAKITQPLKMITGVEPASIVEVGPGHWFFDFGTELMAGIELEWFGGNASLNIRASEELVTNNSIKFPMRTGNKFEMDWTTGHGISSLEQHEYWLFRYAELKITTPPLPPSTNTCDFIPPQLDEGQKASFHCPNGTAIDKVSFASYGTPTGHCNSDGSNTFVIDKTCHADSSESVITSLCVGKESCSFAVSNTIFGQDPCHKTPKGFAGAVECSSGAAMMRSNGFPFKLTAWVVNYPWVDSDSSFKSSDEILNSVWELCRNTLKVTSLDTTTDSNTRERLPYEADGYITGSSRYVLQREFAWQRHSTQHNLLNPTWPTEWRQTIPLLAQEDFMKTGETILAKENWEFIKSSSQAHCISNSSGLLDFSHCTRPSGVRDIVDWPEVARDGYQMTDVNTVNNAYAVGALHALAVLANATNKLEEATAYEQRATALSGAMANKLFDKSTGLFVDGQGGNAGAHSAWHAQVFPLFFGAGLAEQSAQLLNFLKSKRMTGSVYAAFAFLLGLYQFGDDHGAFALEMMTTCDDNSWCNMIKQGATAVMEAWTREEKPNLSWSHPWASAPATAIAQGLMGITALAPGYRQFEVRPQPGALDWAELKLPVLSGFIEVRVDQSALQFELSITAPGNTEATVCLPCLGDASMELVVDGQSKIGYKSGDFACISGVGSGKHRIVRKAGEVFLI